MDKILNWIFGKGEKYEGASEQPPVEFASVDEEKTDSPYLIQIKHNLIHDSFEWRVVERETGYVPHLIRGIGTMSGTSYSRSSAIKTAKKRVEKLEAQRRNREQKWEDVDV